MNWYHVIEYTLSIIIGFGALMVVDTAMDIVKYWSRNRIRRSRDG